MCPNVCTMLKNIGLHKKSQYSVLAPLQQRFRKTLFALKLKPSYGMKDGAATLSAQHAKNGMVSCFRSDLPAFFLTLPLAVAAAKPVAAKLAGWVAVAAAEVETTAVEMVAGEASFPPTTSATGDGEPSAGGVALTAVAAVSAAAGVVV